MSELKQTLGKAAWPLYYLIALVIHPALIFWSVNTVLEQSGISTFIPHNPWTYGACYIIVSAIPGRILLNKMIRDSE